MSQIRSIVASLAACSCIWVIIMRLQSRNQKVHCEQTHSSFVDDRRREISFIVTPYLLTRVAYECKFASLRYRGCNVNRISLWMHNGMRQLRRSPPRVKNIIKEIRRRNWRFRFTTTSQIDNAETRTRIFVRTCTLIRAMIQAEIYDTEF